MDIAPAHGLDIKSLRILILLLSECSVTRTAELIGLPQPTVSLYLKRLREAFDDPLLVRNGNTLVPTARGLKLEVSIRRILSDLDREFEPPEKFDPARGRHQFKLLLANCFGPTFLPKIISRIRLAAPESVIDVCPMPAYEQLAPLIMEGKADIALGNWPHPPDRFRQLPLFQSDFVGLVGDKSRWAGQKWLSMEQYLAADHLSLTPSGNTAMSPIDARLDELGFSRKIAASVADYGSAPYVLAQTDMIFSTSRHFARELASLVPVTMVELPVDFGTMSFYALWHEREHLSPAHKWLRTVLRDATRDDARPRPVSLVDTRAASH